jgi:subtilisin family serine protease
MAGPHVVGAVALLWSARPDLARDIPTTRALLQSTANSDVQVVPPESCGGTPSTSVPNNSFGFGRVDALAAITTPSPLRNR